MSNADDIRARMAKATPPDKWSLKDGCEVRIQHTDKYYTVFRTRAEDAELIVNSASDLAAMLSAVDVATAERDKLKKKVNLNAFNEIDKINKTLSDERIMTEDVIACLKSEHEKQMVVVNLEIGRLRSIKNATAAIFTPEIRPLFAIADSRAQKIFDAVQKLIE